MNKRKVWVEPLFAEAKDWHSMRRFRLRRLWRVNCEALVVATGQNLKRLLQKRGWGRRPFPTEAAVKVPSLNWEPDESPRHEMLKGRRRSIAVASLVAYRATRTFFEPQTGRFSLIITVSPIFSSSLMFIWNTLFYYSLPAFAYLSLPMGLFALLNSCIPSKALQRLFQQAEHLYGTSYLFASYLDSFLTETTK